MCNAAFHRFSFAVSFLYFVVTCIQYWFTDFMVTVQDMDQSVAFTVFAVVSVTGPVLGVIFGGFLSSKLGGYNDPRSLYATAILTFFAMCCALPIPWFSKEYTVL